MKVLIDTSVWSQALRRQSSESLSTAQERVVNVLKELIHDSRIAMLGPVRQELLSGVKTQKQFEALQQILSVFSDETLLKEDYEQAAKNLNQCRQGGVQGSNTDFLICAVSMSRGWPIYSLDKDFLQYQKHLALKLYLG
jgi:predicted nucleic acid-binding protein